VIELDWASLKISSNLEFITIYKENWLFLIYKFLINEYPKKHALFE